MARDRAIRAAEKADTAASRGLSLAEQVEAQLSDVYRQSKAAQLAADRAQAAADRAERMVNMVERAFSEKGKK